MKKNHFKRAAVLILAAGSFAILPACGPQNGEREATATLTAVQAEESMQPSEAAVQTPQASAATIVDTEQKDSKEAASATDSSQTNSGEKKPDTNKKGGGHASSPEKDNEAIQKPNAPISTESPEAASVSKPVPEPTPAPTPTPEPEPVFEWAGSSYGNAVCEGVNEVRALYGLPALSYGGSGGLEEEVEEMARAGSIWGASSRRSVSRSNDGGKTMGIFSATHASEIGQGNYSTLYVASVKYNGTRYTIVEAG